MTRCYVISQVGADVQFISHNLARVYSDEPQVKRRLLKSVEDFQYDILEVIFAVDKVSEATLPARADSISLSDFQQASDSLNLCNAQIERPM